ncbi:hypothetical protein L873DRAFT_1887520 [Choiromyces venosus 120613-1]|uniref:CO dehydrogenase flavoprotein C-terminal domain-containing protein n=1 Tax=Choiromyces venosus 120613-1 TaxID=1336337 RepID=A0A3N4IV12_9PEZI|nr:hypothetical protein L873DRAFT_1887520 [Choiromyces venosus 120613-1]
MPAGNIVTASPISDLNPVLIASGTVLTAQSKTRGEFPLLMKEFFVVYRTTALPADSIIAKLPIPLPAEGTREVIKSCEQAKRKDDDTAIVTAGFRVVLDESSVVTDISLAYGGMAPKTVEAKSSMEALLGKKLFDNTFLEDAVAAMEKDSPLGFTVPGGMPTYRKTPASSFLFRFWHEVAAELELGTQEQQVDHEIIEEIHRGISYGSRDNDNPYEQRVVGKQIPHLSGLQQGTGEAEYIDDMPNIEGQLFGGLVLSKKAHVNRKELTRKKPTDVYNNAGYSQDLSGVVMDHALTYMDSCYWIPHVHLRGHVCKTNTHSNTTFHGFGAPQGQYIAECIIRAIADHLEMSVDELRWKNLYMEGQLTPFLQPLQDWHVPQIITQLKAESDYDAHVQQREEFNRTYKRKKQGISLIPTRFGLSFSTAVHLNQAGAPVHIYNDGSVLLAHGGTEMGQGLYAKMCQIAALELNCPLDEIFTSETSSNTVANTSPTAASSGSDLNGMAVQHACQQLNACLEPFCQKYSADTPLKTLAHAAYLERMNLSANGYYKMPTIGCIWGNYVDPLPMYFYFTQGAAISEVELDVLTGSHTGVRTDIKMDAGRSINPAINYGQIEGAFVQGQGLFTMEEMLWQKNCQLFTRGPGTYKIPGFADIPQVFNVGLLKGVNAKGIGEPPLFLGAGVLFALREAVKAARESVAVEKEGLEVLQLDSPATAERMRVAVGDWIVRWANVEVKEGEKGFLVEAMA